MRVGTWVSFAFLAVAALLLALSAAGRGMPYLLGGLDFLVLGVVLLWAVRHPARRRPDRGIR
ncbi:MAG: hypothetical protein ABR599_06830 [Gemmatimonadota bacterium]